jgi:hypothetical protein
MFRFAASGKFVARERTARHRSHHEKRRRVHEPQRQTGKQQSLRKEFKRSP